MCRKCMSGRRELSARDSGGSSNVTVQPLAKMSPAGSVDGRATYGCQLGVGAADEVALAPASLHRTPTASTPSMSSPSAPRPGPGPALTTPAPTIVPSIVVTLPAGERGRGQPVLRRSGSLKRRSLCLSHESVPPPAAVPVSGTCASASVRRRICAPVRLCACAHLCLPVRLCVCVS